MKAILIDPVAQTVSAVEYNGDYKQIYDLLSDDANGLSVETFTVVGIDDNNSIYVDDEGLLKDPKYFFMYEDYPQPLEGRGLVLGVDDEGESVAPTITLAEVWSKVSFPPVKFTGFEPIPEGTTRHMPGIGEVPVIGHTAQFEEATEDTEK